MNIRKFFIYSTAPLALALSIGAKDAQSASTAKNWAFPDYDTVKDQTIKGDTFNSHLARHYQEMSIYEYQEMYDYFDAETYAERSLAVQAGKTPAPFNPQEWGIEDESNMKELLNARYELISALKQGASSKAPVQAAKAQAKYDCWVEQQEEGWQTKEISACRAEFFSAMNELGEAMHSDASDKTNTTLIITGQAPLMREIAREVVYFDFDKAGLTNDARAKLDKLVAEVKPLTKYKIVVEGHADRAGSAEYNQMLARDRADTVRKELISQGLIVSEIEELKTISEGETEPVVATGDGVPEQRNRRVEIVISGEDHSKDGMEAAFNRQ